MPVAMLEIILIDGCDQATPRFNASLNGVVIGRSSYILADERVYCADIFVDAEYRRIGVMTALHKAASDYFIDKFNKPLEPSFELTPESSCYWRKNGFDLGPRHAIKTYDEWD